MQLIASPRRARPPLTAIVIGALVGLILLAGGLILAWFAFATPMISALTPSVIRPTLPQMALGMAIWCIALVAPPAFAITGAWRLTRVVRAVTARPPKRMVARAAAQLGDEYVAASDVRLPDQRLISDIVLGPYGLAVINQLPPPRFLRRTAGTWEIKAPDGWMPMENPLERASRDAERVRRWIGGVDRDFVVKVFAALVTTDPSVTRTPSCAVVTPEQISAWLLSLPPSRALNHDRREQIVEELTELL